MWPEDTSQTRGGALQLGLCLPCLMVSKGNKGPILALQMGTSSQDLGSSGAGRMGTLNAAPSHPSW